MKLSLLILFPPCYARRDLETFLGCVLLLQVMFHQNRVLPTDPGYVHDKRVDFEGDKEVRLEHVSCM